MDGNRIILSESLRFGSSRFIEIAIICSLLCFASIGKTRCTNSRNQDVIIVVSQILYGIQHMICSIKGDGFWFKQNLTNRHLLRSYTSFFKINAIFRYPLCRSAVFGLYQTVVF